MIKRAFLNCFRKIARSIASCQQPQNPAQHITTTLRSREFAAPYPRRGRVIMPSPRFLVRAVRAINLVISSQRSSGQTTSSFSAAGK
jgi:hypothetical protein